MKKLHKVYRVGTRRHGLVKLVPEEQPPGRASQTPSLSNDFPKIKEFLIVKMLSKCP